MGGGPKTFQTIKGSQCGTFQMLMDYNSHHPRLLAMLVGSDGSERQTTTSGGQGTPEIFLLLKVSWTNAHIPQYLKQYF